MAMQTTPSDDLDILFHALSDSTRRTILRQVAKGEHTVSNIAKHHDLTLAGISKHLRVLDGASLIRRRKAGSFQMISLNPEALKSAGAWLQFYEQFWGSRLDRLKKILENEEK